MIEKSQLEKRVLELHRREPFFHRIDLGNGVVTPGAYGYGLGKVFRLMDRLQLEGRSCLDIGCMDGKAAFEMERRGARVVAIDQYDRRHMRLCMEALDSKATYLTGIRLDEMQAKLAAEGLDRFDVIVNAGVLYHAIAPLRVLIDSRRMLKTGGFMILETGFVDRWDNALYFQCDDSAYMPGSFFFPSRGALLQMLLFVTLVPLAMIVEKDRIAVLTQAMRPSKMPRINSYHDRHHFNWGDLQSGAAECLHPLSMPELEEFPEALPHPSVAATVALPPPCTIVSPYGKMRRLVDRALATASRLKGWCRRIGQDQ